jgi:hypothetical protein
MWSAKRVHQALRQPRGRTFCVARFTCSAFRILLDLIPYAAATCRPSIATMMTVATTAPAPVMPSVILLALAKELP